VNLSPKDRLVVNKTLRRRAGFFGFNTGLAIASFLILCCGLIAVTVLPIGIVLAVTASLFLTTIYVLRDGTDSLVSKIRRPRHYTRGGLTYTPLFKTNVQNQTKAQTTKRKKSAR
jgi:hypothetical protein